MTGSDSQIDKPQRGRPKRAELPDVNINTGAQSINTERASSRGWGGERGNCWTRNTLVESTWLIAYLPTGRLGGRCDKINILLATFY